MYEKIAEYLQKNLNVQYEKDVSMKEHTSFKIGGNADIMLFPTCIEQIKDTVCELKQEGIPFFILGKGSNLLVSDRGIEGAVIKLSGLTNARVCGGVITAECGISLATLSKIALANRLSGIEFASGIPGSLGGAVYMNAGAYGGQMSDVVQSTVFMDCDGVIGTVSSYEHEFGYRSSIFSKKDMIVLSTTMKLLISDEEKIQEKMLDLNSRRREKQPLGYPSAGSVFKRPDGYFAGKLIEDCGLNGCQIGGAVVSDKHSGFIVNAGNATCEDVQNLIAHIQSQVYAKFGVSLETEIKMVGR